MLWSAWLVANVGMWMNDVAAAWMMTNLTASPAKVALVQSASTLPVFLLGLASGALADIIDRRRFLIFTQFWVAGVALLLCAAVLTGILTPTLLLVLTFANGIGFAMRWPVFSAIVPDLVTRPQLPQAIALNGIAMNASRIAGPILAGALIASFGSAYVFILNAVLSVGTAFVIMRWKTERKTSALPGERFLGAIRVGVAYVWQSRSMHVVMLQVAIFFAQSSGLLALLPLVARGLKNGGAGSFTLLLASMGAGAIVAATLLPRLRARFDRNALVRNGTSLQAVAMVVIAMAPNVYIAAPAMVVSGMAWITVANTLSVAAQLSLPNWVRARGMSINQMAMMGGSALGAALWGYVASHSTVMVGLLTAALCGMVAMALAMHHVRDSGEAEDLTPTDVLKPPTTAIPVDPHDGPVLTTIEYRINPTRAAEFHTVMQQTRSSRLSRGVLSWSLFRDTSEPGRYIEHIVDENWVEHLRRFDRMTAADVQLRARRLAFHLGPGEPVITRSLGEALDEH